MNNYCNHQRVKKKITELCDGVLPVMGKEISDYLKNNYIYVKFLQIAGNAENSLGFVTDLLIFLNMMLVKFSLLWST